MSRPKTILLIDDEIDLQALVSIALRAHGYSVVVANNGLEGLQRLKATKPDLIILDMNMPTMGGLEFYQNICDNHSKPRYPVLVLTARANMEELFKEFDINGFMAKPFEIDYLMEEINIILKANAGMKTTSLGDREHRRVCVIDNNLDLLDQVGAGFLYAGYMINYAISGAEGIARVAEVVPDVVLVRLDLPDISGDMVILKLKMMAKTKNIKYILYTDKDLENAEIIKKIGDKEGIDCIVEFVEPTELIEAVNEMLGV